MAFTIKELESLSGIKAHTIRIWEQRYNFLKPGRTATNVRMYSNEELKTLLTVALLNKYGYKISRIDGMSLQQRLDTALKLQVREAENERLINELIGCMIDLKSVEFEKLLNDYIYTIGLFESIPLIFQLLEKLGLLWQSNKVIPAQEHIVSNIIRQKIISAIDQLPLQTNYSPLVILFLPEYEHHELGLLFVFYLLKKRGVASIYLGADVPLKDIQHIVQAKKPQFLYTHLVSLPRQFNFEKFLQQLSGGPGETKILVSGPVASAYSKKIPPGVHLLKSFNEASSYISNIKIG
jgi:DNA-binding transcriptional MerR regulator